MMTTTLVAAAATTSERCRPDGPAERNTELRILRLIPIVLSREPATSPPQGAPSPTPKACPDDPERAFVRGRAARPGHSHEVSAVKRRTAALDVLLGLEVFEFLGRLDLLFGVGVVRRVSFSGFAIVVLLECPCAGARRILNPLAVFALTE
jgi:hypothetical protein